MDGALSCLVSYIIVDGRFQGDGITLGNGIPWIEDESTRSPARMRVVEAFQYAENGRESSMNNSASSSFPVAV